jgi:hypothetical protein
MKWSPPMALTADQRWIVERWDVETRCLFEELAAHYEYNENLDRKQAEIRAFEKVLRELF